jgi:hypothetical protein
VKNTSQTFTDCICATDYNCQSSVTIYGWSRTPDGFVDYTTPYLIPGMATGCFTIDSLLLSTLECFYLDSCLSVLYNTINITLSAMDTGLTWFQIHPLVYDRESSRFPPNTSLSIIVREIMIEQWNLSASFDRYYEACAPVYCMYSYSTRASSFIEIIIKLVSMVGGLTVALRLITPQLIKLVFKLLKRKTKRRRRGNSY